ncbi:hypothetical protein WAB17_05975 [Parerythrobacter aurantius]|uniref:hypothetical protein n=1 Tax=Parerythrobacter aurantius TaxID=3127706 RepID=UPI00324CA54C
MSLVPVFLLGIANFALHRAVLAARHPFLDSVRAIGGGVGGKLSLYLEFLVLVAALMLARLGYPGVAWVYATYSGLNALTAWLLLSRRR